MKIRIPLGRILRRLSKAVKLSKGGFTPDEARELAGDLAGLAADVLDQVEKQP